MAICGRYREIPHTLMQKDLHNDIAFFNSPTCLCLGHVIFYCLSLLCFVVNDRKGVVKYHKPFVKDKDLKNDIEWYRNTENF